MKTCKEENLRVLQGAFEFIKCKIQKNIHSSAQHPAEVSNIDRRVATCTHGTHVRTWKSHAQKRYKMKKIIKNKKLILKRKQNI